MPVTTKTKAIAALGLLDVVRQVTTAWSARERAERERIGFGRGVRQDVRRLASEARERTPDLSRWELERGWPPIHRRSTAASRVRTWAPVAVIVALASAAILVAAHVVARRDEDRDVEETVTDSRVIGAARAGSNAIDAGVAKVVDGGAAVATGAAAATAAGSSAIKSATVNRARVELDEHVVAPAKRKAITFGTIGFAALTAYVIVLAAAVQLVVQALD